MRHKTFFFYQWTTLLHTWCIFQFWLEAFTSILIYEKHIIFMYLFKYYKWKINSPVAPQAPFALCKWLQLTGETFLPQCNLIKWNEICLNKYEKHSLNSPQFNVYSLFNVKKAQAVARCNFINFKAFKWSTPLSNNELFCIPQHVSHFGINWA